MADSQESKVKQPAQATHSSPEATPAILDSVPETITPDFSADNSSSSPPKDPSSPARRPLTRSQTGTVPKRRARDDSDVPDTKKRPSAPRKRQKTSSAPVEDVPEPKDSHQIHKEPDSPAAASSPHPTRASREVSVPSSVSSGAAAQHSNVDGTNQITFCNTSSATSEEQQSDCRLPRSRASLPTPIPNLTKKSRGRRVPTQDSGVTDPEKKDHRLYVCTVDGCGKCFHRGEHLKRHIRSIHTHEKPFKCTYPLCQKYFNRHDNLLQHLKVHREPAPKESVVVEHKNNHHHHLNHNHHNHNNHPHSQQNYHNHNHSHSHVSSSSTPPHRRQQHQHYQRSSYSPNSDEPESPTIATATASAPVPLASHTSEPRTIYNAFPRTIYSSSNSSNVNVNANSNNTGYSTSFPSASVNASFTANSSSMGLGIGISHHNGGGGVTFSSSNSSGANVSSNNDSINLLASMAVSSLRTEIPPSPIDARASSALRSSLY